MLTDVLHRVIQLAAVLTDVLYRVIQLAAVLTDVLHRVIQLAAVLTDVLHRVTHEDGIEELAARMCGQCYQSSLKRKTKATKKKKKTWRVQRLIAVDMGKSSICAGENAATAISSVLSCCCCSGDARSVEQRPI